MKKLMTREKGFFFKVCVQILWWLLQGDKCEGENSRKVRAK